MPNKRQALFTLIWVVVNEVTMAFAALGFCALHCAYDPLQEHSSTRWMPLGIITFCRARDLGERRCTTENTCSRPPPHQPSCGCATSPQLRMQCRTQLVPPCSAHHDHRPCTASPSFTHCSRPGAEPQDGNRCVTRLITTLLTLVPARAHPHLPAFTLPSACLLESIKPRYARPLYPHVPLPI